LIVYPSTLLHRVEPVSDARRLVCVGWIPEPQSASAEQRELLFLRLDRQPGALLFSQQGKGEALST